MPTQINEIPKVFQPGETLESSELNAIISQINSTIRKLNSVETSLDNHEYDVSIPITNIYCRTKKGINAINFFPQADAKRDELFERVSACETSRGIKYDSNFFEVAITDNPDQMNGIWTAYPQGINESLPHEWTVSFKKLDNGEIRYMFGPVLTSNYGHNGQDGDGVQYVYKLFSKELTEEERILNTPQKPLLPNNEGEYIPAGWTDDPQGPTKELQYEYVATLKRTQGNWGEFEKISLWSKYSEDGSNGDFQMRVFCRYIATRQKPSPNTPVGGTYEYPYPTGSTDVTWSTSVPTGDGPIWTSTKIFKGTGQTTEWSTPALEADSAELDIEYSSVNERPNANTLRTVPKTQHPSINVWHDPNEANIDLSAMIWRAERKIKNGAYDGEWVITRIKGVAGSFKSMVFRRFKPTIQQAAPPIPSGGTYENPIPDGNLWFDGIPAGDSKTNGPIWASVRTFYNDGTQSSWSEPQLQADSEDLDIEFSPGIGEEHTQPSNPTGEPFSNRNAQKWYDPSYGDFNLIGPMIWRAERKVNNGKYVGNWTVTRIYGEKGEIGPQGKRGSFKSCVFKRSNSVINNFNAVDGSGNIIDGATYDNPIPNGSGDFAGWTDGIPSGDETLWMAVSKFSGDNDNHTNWTVTQQTDSIDLDIEFSPGDDCPPMDLISNNGNTVFTHPINNYESDGSTKTSARIARENAGWYDASALPAEQPIIWRAERKVHNQQYEGDWIITRIQGEKGDDAVLTDAQQQDLEVAGLQILVTPQNIILDQTDVLTGSTDDKIDDVVANIVVYDRTGQPLPNNKYQIKVTNNVPAVELYANEYKINGVMAPLSSVTNYLEISGTNTTDSKSIKVKNLPITTTTVNGTSTYTYTYNKGYIRVILTVSVGENVTKNVKIDIPWYLNKLGERITKLKGDLESTLMSKTSFSDPNDPIISNYTASILDGADGKLFRYGLIKNKQGGGYEASFDAQYLQNAAENISKLSKSITGTNLIADTGWSNNFYSTGGSSVLGSTNPRTLCSPFMKLSPGEYIFSCYVPNTVVTNGTLPNGNLIVKMLGFNKKQNPEYIAYTETSSNVDYIKTNLSSTEYTDAIKVSKSGANGFLVSDTSTRYTGDYYVLNNNTYVRMYFVLTVEQDLYYTLYVQKQNSNNSPWSDLTTCLRPQLELRLESNENYMPTAWTPGPQDFSSEIKQTAGTISVTATTARDTANDAITGLNNLASNIKDTGIIISGENRYIEMYADKFKLKDTNDNIVFGKEDGSNNVTFTGDVIAKSLTAGSQTGMKIVTASDTIQFVNANNVTVGRFVINGNGLEFYILNSEGKEYKIKWDSWASTTSSGTDSYRQLYAKTSNNGFTEAIKVYYSSSKGKYYSDQAGTSLANGIQLYEMSTDNINQFLVDLKAMTDAGVPDINMRTWASGYYFTNSDRYQKVSFVNGNKTILSGTENLYHKITFNKNTSNEKVVWVTGYKYNPEAGNVPIGNDDALSELLNKIYVYYSYPSSQSQPTVQKISSTGNIRKITNSTGESSLKYCSITTDFKPFSGTVATAERSERTGTLILHNYSN